MNEIKMQATKIPSSVQMRVEKYSPTLVRFLSAMLEVLAAMLSLMDGCRPGEFFSQKLSVCCIFERRNSDFSRLAQKCDWACPFRSRILCVCSSATDECRISSVRVGGVVSDDGRSENPLNRRWRIIINPQMGPSYGFPLTRRDFDYALCQLEACCYEDFFYLRRDNTIW